MSVNSITRRTHDYYGSNTYIQPITVVVIEKDEEPEKNKKARLRLREAPKRLQEIHRQAGNIHHDPSHP